MYVSSHGVTRPKPRRTEYFDAWLQRRGQTQISPSRLSRLNVILSKANSTVAVVLVAALLATTAIALVVRDSASASVRPDAAVRSFGAAAQLEAPSIPTNEEVVAIASTTEDAAGFWIATKSGNVYPVGNAPDLGKIERTPSPIADIASTSTGNGYWLTNEQGQVYAFGDAKYLGGVSATSTPDVVFVALLPTTTSNGYALVDSKGNVVTFGDATDYGRALMLEDNDAIVDAAVSHDGNGYVMLSKTGSVFAFGDARFYGGAHPGLLSADAAAISPTDDGKGYWILAKDGGIFTFGDADFLGSAVQDQTAQMPSVDLAIFGDGDGYWIAKDEEPKKVLRQSSRAGSAAPGPVAGTQIDSNSSNADVWAALRNCEAGGNYGANTGNGYYGAYQFSARTWRSMNTGYEYAHLAPPEVQDDAARRLQARSGWGQWPACSRKIGVR